MGVDVASSDLANELAGSLLTDPVAMEPFSRDFGGIVRRTPRAVARPSSVEDLQALVRWASRTDTPLVLRGAGHSQGGHVLTERGVVVDMRGIDAISDVDTAKRMVEVGGGASWSAVVERTRPFGLAPCVLTTEHATTVGGTLSAGGYGSTSHRYGAQVNNVAYLDVIDGTGEIRRCSSVQNAELFDCARAGLGQFGIIARAGLSLRPIRSRVRTFVYSYDDAEPFLEDLARLMRDRRATHLLAHFTEVAGTPRQRLRLTAGIEYEPGDVPDDSRLGELNSRERVSANDVALFGENHIFYFRHEDWFGAPDTFVAPWIDHLFDWDDARAYLEATLAGRYTPMLHLGPSTLIPTAAVIHSAPLAARFGGAARAEPLLGVGLFPRLPNDAAGVAGISAVYDADVKREYRGRRYLQGYCDSSKADWASEWGELWPWVREMKRRFDPAGVFNPDFMDLRAGSRGRT